MDSPGDIMRLCRLCLVKDQVNVPIFEDKGDIKKIFLKISSCLPVKVSRDDKLPKKICDGCSNKLDMLYEFWTTAANAEKTLLSWLGQAGVKDNDADETMSAVAQQIQKPAEPYVKQETLDPEAATNASEVGDHFLLQNFMQKFSYNESASTGPSATVTSNAETDEPPPKRARRTAAVKAQINISAESEEDDDNDAMEAMTKVEDESDESDGEDREPTYVDVPGTSGADDDQPGPSGVGKDGVEAPISTNKTEQEPPPKPRRGRPPSNKLPDWMDEPKLHPDNKTEMYECRKCDKSYDTKHKLQKHSYTHREKKFTCDFCSKRFLFSNQLHLHRHNVHLKEKPKKQINCPHCDKVFKERKWFKKHVKTHDPEYKSEFVCPLCEKPLTCESYLKAHLMKRHNGEKRFPSYYRKFVCEICGKEMLKKNLKIHMMSHTGERPFECGYCGKGFVTRKCLRIHIRVHTKEKPYECPICFKGFTQKYSVTVHMRYHTGERPHTCQICFRSFVTKSEVKNHNCSGPPYPT